MFKYLKVYSLVFTLVCAFTAAQSAEFQPVPPELKNQYRLNFKNFFPSSEAEVLERKIIENELKELEAMKEHISTSGTQMLKAFELLDKIRLQFRRHDLYLFFRYATNMKDEASQKDASALRSMAIQARQIVEHAVLDVSENKLKEMFQEEPTLGKYRFAIEAIQRKKPFTLPADQEQMLNEIGALADGSFYQQTINELHFGTIKTAEGKLLDVAQQRGEIENHPDPRVRSEGTKKLSDAYATKRDVFALGLIQMIQLQNKIAQLHKFKNLREESYFEDYVSLQEIKNTYDEIAKESALYRRFEKIQDQARNSTAAQNPRFSIVETSQIVKKAVAPLGEEYVSEMCKLLDPKNGRIDIVRAENRLPMQGGASVYPIGISTFFAFNYEGFYIDVMLIAHEAGHAVQAMLMSSSQVPMAYAAGPGYFTESFGRFNEFIVADYLAKHEPDPLRKKYFVRQFAERAFALFPSVIEASVESEIHQGIEDGQIRNADDIDRITQLTGSKYSDAFKSNRERKMMWMDAPEYYVAPLHKMHNVFASVLALKYYQMYTQNPKDFASRYMALLRNGYNASPDVLLKKFLNIDFRDPELTNDALTFLKDQLRQLESN